MWDVHAPPFGPERRPLQREADVVTHTPGFLQKAIEVPKERRERGILHRSRGHDAGCCDIRSITKPGTP
jgi:hypothetical protein